MFQLADNRAANRSGRGRQSSWRVDATRYVGELAGSTAAVYSIIVAIYRQRTEAEGKTGGRTPVTKRGVGGVQAGPALHDVDSERPRDRIKSV